MGEVNFKIKFSLLGLNEMSRSTEKSYIDQPQPLGGEGVGLISKNIILLGIE